MIIYLGVIVIQEEFLSMLADIYSQFKEHTTPKLRKTLLITGIFTVIIGITIGKVYQQRIEVIESKENSQEAIQAVWDKTEAKVRATSSLDIKFNEIDTPRSIYRELEQGAYDIVNYTDYDTQDAKVESNLEVDNDEQYIVSGQSNDTEGISKESNMRLVSGIYCKDMYIAQYMNKDGQFETIIASYNGESVDVKYRTDYKANSSESVTGLEGTVDEHTRDSLFVISEDEYKSDIGYVIANIYNRDGKGLSELKPITDVYFTSCIEELYNSIGDRGVLDFTRIGLMEVGKSNIDANSMDRVYIQIELSIDNKPAYVDLELKLGNDNKVYDIDVL